MTLNAYQKFVKHYFATHNGATMEQAARAWNSKGGGGGGGGGRRRAASCSSNVVPTADGTAVTTRGGAHLRAAIEGHTEVKFDSGALAAIWAGLVEGLRNTNGVNLAALFPDLYPCSPTQQRTKAYQDNFVVGLQAAKLLGAALVAYRVTPEEWAAWYVANTAQNFTVPADRGTCITVSAATMPLGMVPPPGLPAEAINQANQFGGVLGAPGGAMVPNQSAYGAAGGSFGALR